MALRETPVDIMLDRADCENWPDFRDRLLQLGADPLAESPDYFRKMLAAEIERWAKVVKLSHAKPE